MFLSKLGRVEKSVKANTGAVLATRWCGDYTTLVSGVFVCVCVFVYYCVYVTEFHITWLPHTKSNLRFTRNGLLV